MKKSLTQQLRINLLHWYDQHGRVLPWRAKSPDIPNPYHVWLSEMMLQQTTVVTVLPYFRAFLERWPTLHDLSSASQDEILHAWQGLGYYARARNLHKCAQELKGHFPHERDELLKLPGIGSYMSAAIASIAFNQPVVPVDGNVIRVLSRLKTLKTKDINQVANDFAQSHRPGDFAQALMDLGATICTPKAPRCSLCPWQENCKAFREGNPENYPFKEPKKDKPTRYALAFIMIDAHKRILIRKRPEKGLLAGLYEVPTTDWSLSKDEVNHMSNSVYKGQIKHTFTHFHLKIDVYAVLPHKQDGIWVDLKDLDQYALSTLMKKVIATGISTYDDYAQTPQHLRRLSCGTGTYTQPERQKA